MEASLDSCSQFIVGQEGPQNSEELCRLLQQALLTCKTLVDLRLVDVKNVPMTGTSSSVVYLPALKKLELGRFKYESEESLVRLLSGCPALEELTIIKNDVDNVFRLRISSPTLTRLDLDIQNYNNFDKYYDVKLDTPALEYLCLYDKLSRDFSAGMLASLTEADVNFNLDVLDPRSVLEFVGKLNNVSCLNLKISFKLPDSAWTDSTLISTQFRNLTKLELDGDWRFLTTFLENSDNLQVLFVDMDDKHQYWMEPKQVPVCLKNHLQTIRIYSFDDFKCSHPELNMVKYVLNNAKVLTMMEIYVDYCRRRLDLKKKKEALERITLFERASEACQLAFN